MPFHTIIKEVVVDTSTNYVNDDVLFVDSSGNALVELQLPAKDCIIHGGRAVIMNRGNTAAQLNADECALHFFQNTTHAPGGLSQAFGLTGAQMEANGYLGSVQFGSSIIPQDNYGYSGDVDYKMTKIGNIGVSVNSTTAVETPYMSNLVLTSTNIGNTVFMVGTIDGISTSPDFVTGDEMRFIFHVEY